jgi:hypothetical protein
MKVEPCLYCGGEMVESVIGDFRCLQCGAWVQYGDVQTHNRICYIVRAAEEWARLLPHGPSGEYVKAVDALFEAVEGGRSDG